MIRWLVILASICLFLQSCEGEEKKQELHMREYSYSCIRMYNNTFGTDSLLLRQQLKKINEIRTIDTLKLIYESERGFFNVQFENIDSSVVDFISVRYISIDVN